MGWWWWDVGRGVYDEGAGWWREEGREAGRGGVREMGRGSDEMGADWERTGSGLGAGWLGMLKISELLVVNLS